MTRHYISDKVEQVFHLWIEHRLLKLYYYLGCSQYHIDKLKKIRGEKRRLEIVLINIVAIKTLKRFAQRIAHWYGQDDWKNYKRGRCIISMMYHRKRRPYNVYDLYLSIERRFVMNSREIKLNKRWSLYKLDFLAKTVAQFEVISRFIRKYKFKQLCLLNSILQYHYVPNLFLKEILSYVR